MIDYEKFLQTADGTLEKTLSVKDDCAVLSMKRCDGSPYVLRIYRRQVPAYQALCDSPSAHLPRIYRCSSADGCFLTEEEYIDGISLQHIIQNSTQFSAVKARDIAAAVCRSVSDLHDRGFIHRDIKPEHILITEDGRILLIDLDASMRIENEKASDTQLLGTAGYAAPEQFGFTRSDQRTDIFSIGVLLNEMLTGCHPSVKLYEDGSLAKVIEKCTNINPKKRYQSISEILDALTLAESESAPASEAASAKSKKPLLAAVIAIAVIIAAAAGIYAFGPGQSPAEDPESEPAKQAEAGPATVEGTDYLQLYKDGNSTVYYNFRQGGQGAALSTEDGAIIDQTYNVYADKEVGAIVWAEEFEAWVFDSSQVMPGSKGYIHAEKDGKHYAIECLTFGEPVCMYSQIPDVNDLSAGYLLPEKDRNRPDQCFINLVYHKDKKTVMYLAAAPGFSLDDAACDSDLVTIDPPTTGTGNYPYPVSKVTFENPAGGQCQLVFTSQYGTITVTMTEE